MKTVLIYNQLKDLKVVTSKLWSSEKCCRNWNIFMLYVMYYMVLLLVFKQTRFLFKNVEKYS